MKLATWNINSIKARLEHVVKFLAAQKPDALLLQELKGLAFPDDAFTALGYHVLAVGQKAYNGVAVLTKEPATIILNQLEDEQARYLEVDMMGLRLINIYLPNGNPWPGPKFDYKLGWMEKLYIRLKDLRAQNIPFIIGGDFNVIPEARDCYNPKAWENDALYRIETRQMFRKMLGLGLTDAFRVHNQESEQYTFWDYTAGCWPANKGLRIDHFLLTPEITDRLASCTIDIEPRGWERPSDHTPVILELNPLTG